jgi:hypothetical protein
VATQAFRPRNISVTFARESALKCCLDRLFGIIGPFDIFVAYVIIEY